MKREILARELDACTTRAQLLDVVEALVKQQRDTILDQVQCNLDTRDPGYNRVVNRLMALRQEK